VHHADQQLFCFRGVQLVPGLTRQLLFGRGNMWGWFEFTASRYREMVSALLHCSELAIVLWRCCCCWCHATPVLSARAQLRCVICL
jgi:hypothetical protein